MIDSTILTLGTVALSAILCLPITRRPTQGLTEIPTYGPSGGPIFGIYNSLCLLLRGRKIIDDAHALLSSNAYANASKGKRPQMFKIQLFSGWNVFVLGKNHIADVRSAKGKDLSLYHAQNDILALDYTIGSVPSDEDDLHNKVLQRMLASNYTENGSDLYDETLKALDVAFPVSHDGWHAATCYKSVLNIIARVTNRFYVGEPLCRDNRYIALVMDFVQGVPQAGMLINIFPRWLHPYIAHYISPLPKYQKRALAVFGDLINERIALHDKHGKDWDLKPRDMVTWFLEEAEQYQRNAETITIRILRVNFAGLMSTSFFLPQVLYKLMLSPESEYIAPIREEIDAVVEKYGWTKEALGKMYKLDSFMREVARTKGFSALVLHRKVMAPSGWAFHDGITIPAGTHLSAASCISNIHESAFEEASIHGDDCDATHEKTIHETKPMTEHEMAHMNYNCRGTYQSDPTVFDGMRFARMYEKEVAEKDAVGEAEGALGMKYQLTSPSLDNLFYGVGKHACPGRFIMTFIMKLQVAVILNKYDIKVKDGFVYKDNWLGTVCMPDRNAEILYRKRST